ncbi:MAG: hypothetical protein ACJAQ0_000863 [Dasania sp.]
MQNKARLSAPQISEDDRKTKPFALYVKALFANSCPVKQAIYSTINAYAIAFPLSRYSKEHKEDSQPHLGRDHDT